MSPTMVIGVGNPYRHDDAAGLEVARLVEDVAIPGVVVLEHEGDPAGLIQAWNGAGVAYVVDAVRSGAAPGTVHTLQLDESGIPEHPKRDSSHSMGLGEAVELGKVLGRLPRTLVVIGIEGEVFDAGVGLTDEVAASVKQVAGQIVDGLLEKGSSHVPDQAGPVG